MKLGDALQGARRPRILRNLQITDVSSVDQGAGRNVRVILTKRGTTKEATMSRRSLMKTTCPHCGKSFDGPERGEGMDKADSETIAKASTLVLKSIAEDISKAERIPMSQAMIRAAMSPEYSEAHVQERRMKFGA
jgi:hypothetical protein